MGKGVAFIKVVVGCLCAVLTTPAFTLNVPAEAKVIHSAGMGGACLCVRQLYRSLNDLW